MDELYALMVPEIRQAFLLAMQDIVDRAILDEMIKAIENNDAEALFKATGFTPAALSPILDAVEKSYYESANLEVKSWPARILTPAGYVIFRFDLRNTVVEKDLRDFSSQFVTRITDEARSNVRIALERGMISGNNPRQTALDIVGRINKTTGKREGGIIGLTANQEGWVANTERYLKQFDNRYFTLKLRDKRFDSVVKKAFNSGESLSKDYMDKLLVSYKSRVLKYRAETIARTETIQSLNRGAAISYEQAIAEGTLSRQQITKGWDDVGDKKVRHTHRSMASKYPKNKGIGLSEPFISPSGARLMFPGDTSLGAGANEISNCRCKTQYNVNWRYGLKNGK